MALKDIIDQQVANAFNNVLAPGGLTETVQFRVFKGQGEYDVENDTYETTYEDTEVVVVVTKPGFDDVKNHEVIFSDAKLIFPGSFLAIDPEPDTDKVIRANGEEWDVKKVVGVPGRGVLIVYIYRT